MSCENVVARRQTTNKHHLLKIIICQEIINKHLLHIMIFGTKMKVNFIYNFIKLLAICKEYYLLSVIENAQFIQVLSYPLPINPNMTNLEIMTDGQWSTFWFNYGV